MTRSSRCPGTHRLPVRLQARLLSRLESEPNIEAVVGIDPAGHEQPLQLALRRAAAEALVAAAGPSGAAGVSARRLLDALRPGLVSHELGPAELWDIDTPDQLLAWRLQVLSSRFIDLESGGRAPEGSRPSGRHCHRRAQLLGQVDLGGRHRPSIGWLNPGGRRLLSGHPAELDRRTARGNVGRHRC